MLRPLLSPQHPSGPRHHKHHPRRNCRPFNTLQLPKFHPVVAFSSLQTVLRVRATTYRLSITPFLRRLRSCG